MSNELYHHGILGMKWGVRRYQNYDGSYTQAGLKRYKKSEKKYQDKKDAYDSVRTRYKAGEATKLELNAAKRSVRESKSDLSKRYNQLKYDKRADQGKTLYMKGKTIGGNTRIENRIDIGVGAAALAGVAYVNSSHFTKVATGSNSTKAAIAVGSYFVGTRLAGEIGKAVLRKDDAKLRAYYAHGGNK